MRRRSLLGGLAALVLMRAASAEGRVPPPGPRALRLYNINTGERFRGEYFDGTDYLRSASEELNWLLRDHHSGQATVMDPKVFDLMWRLADQYRWAGHGGVTINVHSAYRTHETNEALRSEGAAQNSRHLTGQAVDVTVQGYGIYFLANHVEHIGAGGIGIYWAEKFVHIDTGPPRRWYSRF